ncbi:hypothetical protein niasHT_029135 [Heterodera trifolii]|uniref:Uncharacterized protein n=1 Tax=Heterodera trifolii TaxID=157864 RepID=A0ABD2K1R9_9BILA
MVLIDLSLLLILSQVFATIAAEYEQITKLRAFLCRDLAKASNYRKKEEWRKLGTFTEKVPKNLLDSLAKWQFQYLSIERLFKFCIALKEGKTVNFDERLLVKISLKPKFVEEKSRKELTIEEAMRQIVTAHKIIFVGKPKKIIKKCIEYCKIKKQLPQMRFENRENCFEVINWAFVLENNNEYQMKDNALSELEKVKQYLLSLADGKNPQLNIRKPPQKPMQKEKEVPNRFHGQTSVRNRHISSRSEANKEQRRDDFYDDLEFQLMMQSYYNRQNSECRDNGDKNAAGRALQFSPSSSSSSSLKLDDNTNGCFWISFDYGSLIDNCFTGIGNCFQGVGDCVGGCCTGLGDCVGGCCTGLGDCVGGCCTGLGDCVGGCCTGLGDCVGGCCTGLDDVVCSGFSSD